jgi:hypothetical protein
VLALGGVGAAVLLVGAGFVAGLAVHRGDGTALVASRGSIAGQVPGLGDGDEAGVGDGRVAGAGVIVGRVSAVTDSTLTLATSGGQELTVVVTSATTVGGVAGGDLSALRAGQVVAVAGTQGSDGGITATAIMVGRTRGERGPSGPGGAGSPDAGTDGTGTESGGSTTSFATDGNVAAV